MALRLSEAAAKTLAAGKAKVRPQRPVARSRRVAVMSPESHLHIQLAAVPYLGGYRRQYRFAASIGRQWRLDFAWLETDYGICDRKFGVEVEGGIWRKGGGAHSHPQNILRDIEKHNDLTRLGWQVLRVTTDQVRTGEALRMIEAFFKDRGWKPSGAS